VTARNIRQYRQQLVDSSGPGTEHEPERDVLQAVHGAPSAIVIRTESADLISYQDDGKGHALIVDKIERA